MTKEEARKRLEEWVLEMTYTNPCTNKLELRLPIHDENFMIVKAPEPKLATTLQEQEDLNDRQYTFEQISFRYLLSVAYDLKLVTYDLKL